MFLIKLYQLIMGYIIFSAQGGFPERFINLCSVKKITLWDISYKDGTMYAKTDIKGYLRIRPVARNSGTRVRMQKKCGLPFFINRYKNRIGLVIGVIFLIVGVSLLSNRIWVIEVEGNETVTQAEILNTFETLDLKIGTKADNIDSDSLKRTALSELSDISWLSINIKGSIATIEVRERDKAPEIDFDESPADITAKKSGQLIILEPYAGTPMKDLYTVIFGGDVLVSSIQEHSDFSASLKRANAYAVARTENNIRVVTPRRQTKRTYTREKNSYVFYILGVRIPLGFQLQDEENCESYQIEKYLSLDGKKMPVGIIRTNHRYYTDDEVTLSADKCYLLGLGEFNELSRTNLHATQILGQKITAVQTDSGININGNYSCYENIGVTTPVATDMIEMTEPEGE